MVTIYIDAWFSKPKTGSKLHRRISSIFSWVINIRPQCLSHRLQLDCIFDLYWVGQTTTIHSYFKLKWLATIAMLNYCDLLSSVVGAMASRISKCGIWSWSKINVNSNTTERLISLKISSLSVGILGIAVKPFAVTSVPEISSTSKLSYSLPATRSKDQSSKFFTFLNDNVFSPNRRRMFCKPS